MLPSRAAPWPRQAAPHPPRTSTHDLSGLRPPRESGDRQPRLEKCYLEAVPHLQGAPSRQERRARAEPQAPFFPTDGSQRTNVQNRGRPPDAEMGQLGTALPAPIVPWVWPHHLVLPPTPAARENRVSKPSIQEYAFNFSYKYALEHLVTSKGLRN